MNITTPDGRSFSGTPIQIVRQMQSLSFGQQKAPYRHYVVWMIDNAQRFNAVALHVPALDTGSDDEVAEQLLAELARTGLLEEQGQGQTTELQPSE